MKNSILINIINKYIKSNSGAVLPIAALLFPIILGMAGMGVDVSNWLMQRRNLQTAADAAVMAAAWEVANGSPEYMDSSAIREAQQNGYNPTGNTLTLIYTESNNGDNPCGDDEDDIDGDDDDDLCTGDTIQVTITQEVDVWFSSIFMRDRVNSATTATAEISADGEGNFCMLSLDETANGAITTSGTVQIDATGCGMAINSNSASALSMNGNVEINIGEVSINGDYSIKGGAAELNAESIDTNAGTIEDPYADLEVPAFSECSSNDKKNPVSTSAGGNITFSPGVYCGGLSISGNSNVTFDPGVYIIDGGDFNVTGNGSLYGEGVSFVLTNGSTGPHGDYGNLDVSGGREIYFSAPEEGFDMEGVVFFQDPNAPSGNNNNYSNGITGNSTLELDGVAYFPSRELNFGGGSNSSSNLESPCTKLIAKTIVLHGNPLLANNCQDSAARSIGDGESTVALIN